MKKFKVGDRVYSHNCEASRCGKKGAIIRAGEITADVLLDDGKMYTYHYRHLSHYTEERWIVWSPQGGNPTVIHPTCSAAQHEVDRLARGNQGKTFYACQLRYSAVLPEPTPPPLVTEEF